MIGPKSFEDIDVFNDQKSEIKICHKPNGRRAMQSPFDLLVSMKF